MWLLLLACADEGPEVAVVVDEAWLSAFSGLPRITAGDAVASSTEPLGSTVVIEVSGDLDCDECFRVERDGDRFTVHAGGVGGAQYGVYAVLEGYGYRLGHPYDPEQPAALSFDDDGLIGVEMAPEIARRGIHLHTLHPIEGLDAVWGLGEIDDAEAILDWLVWNRGNYLQWPALDDVTDPGVVQGDWRERTTAIIDAAHVRGVEVGVGVQLFGTSNLQQAYDLVDQPGTMEEDEASIAARAETFRDLGFDNFNLSFGEFSGEEPQTFIDRVNLASDAFAEVAPEAEMSAVIHVGNYEDLRVEYEGEELLYYFLVKYANARIVPWIHTVMYYNLFDDAGGAYNHDEFDEHRDFLLSRLRAGERAAYFPETAYWIAFDNSIPTWLPLYVQSRWTDLDGLRREGVTLDEHILFSSGWEWGYWQNDVASLRMSWELPETADDLWPELLGSGEFEAAAVQVMASQHEALIVRRLAPWLSGRDITMDLGRELGIIAAPDWAEFSDILVMDVEARAALETDVVGGLRALAVELESVAAPLSPDGRFECEVVDGLAITSSRARFVADLLGAVLTTAEGGDPTQSLAAAAAEREAGAAIIARRHADLHDADGPWTVDWENATVYDAGYLKHADNQCFWVREEGQVRELLLGEDQSDPGCVF